MDTTIKIIAQELDRKTGKVINQHLVFEKDAIFPKKIHALGFTHKEQIAILQQSQEVMLQAQQDIINDNASICPNCGNKTKKKGKFDSDFHAVFTDHKIKMQRTKCTCGWSSKISIDGIYGSALHPDLVEIQALFGAENSFKKTEEFLAKKCCSKRSINNHGRVQKTINHMGNLFSQVKQDIGWAKSATNDAVFSNELILAIDGAHIQSNDIHKRSFEAITATVYNPENIVKKDKHHNKILFKTVVASAKNDQQSSIKILTKHACLKQGMTKSTKLTALTDGAKNCWSVISELEKTCANVTKILDWFHIGKKFKNFEHCIPDELKEEYNKAKWCLWHNDVEKSLSKLNAIQLALKKSDKTINGLLTYIKNNETHIVNYQKREEAGDVFTSQLAESTVNNLVNERQKHDKRMRWSREGADNILQIRSSKQSGDWENDWEVVQAIMYREAM